MVALRATRPLRVAGKEVPAGADFELDEFEARIVVGTGRATLRPKTADERFADGLAQALSQADDVPQVEVPVLGEQTDDSETRRPRGRPRKATS